jgi:hypothetical protein
MKRLDRILAAVSLATAIAFSIPALADDTARIASQYAAWAGGKSNADSLVRGLRTGSSITLVTVSADRTRSVAGFTAQTQMSPEEISAALASAKSTLARMGVRQPSADQIQAALIGGEVALPNGKSRLVQGSVALRQEPTLSPVAAR